jgi:hypothetical protein
LVGSGGGAVLVGGGGGGVLVGCGRDDWGLAVGGGVLVGGDGVLVAVGSSCTGVGDGVEVRVGDTESEKYRSSSSGVLVGRRVGGLDVGLAVDVAVAASVGDGVAVGVWVAVIVAVSVSVDGEEIPTLTLPSARESTITNETTPTAAAATPTRRSMRHPLAPGQGNRMVVLGGSASIDSSPSP